MNSIAASRVAPEKADFRPALVPLLNAGLSPEKVMSEYSQKLRDPRWQRKRLEIMQRDNFACRLCDDKESTLHVHHLRYTKGAEPWDYNDASLLTICEGCHEELHVMQFGERILETIIGGGINLEELHDLLCVLEGLFCDGPHQAPIPRANWQNVASSIYLVLLSIRNGATEEQISKALNDIGRENVA